MSKYLFSFPQILKFENFNENNVTGVTIREEKKRQMARSNQASENIGCKKEFPPIISGMELVKIPFAVVVSPLKSTVCSSSILNLASLNAEKSDTTNVA